MLLGGLDAQSRPLVRLRIEHAEDELVCVVDTGYNGELWMSAELADTFGLTPSMLTERAEVASGSRVAVRTAGTRIEWLGSMRDVRVHIPERASEQARRRGPDHALLGVGLLRTAVLVANFPIGLVQISIAN